MPCRAMQKTLTLEECLKLVFENNLSLEEAAMRMRKAIFLPGESCETVAANQCGGGFQ